MASSFRFRFVANENDIQNSTAMSNCAVQAVMVGAGSRQVACVFAIVVRSFSVRPGALIAEWARLKSDNRSERVRLGRTAALESEVRLTLSHLGGSWIRGAVVDERTAHALDLSLEASGAAKRLILPRASSCVAAAAVASGRLRRWLRTKSSSKQATHPPGVVGSHCTSGSTDGEEGPTVSSPRLASAGISQQAHRLAGRRARKLRYTP